MSKQVYFFPSPQTHLANESWTRRTPRQSRIFPRGATSRIFPRMHNVRVRVVGTGPNDIHEAQVFRGRQ